jgi:hypothetical protein
VNVINVHQKCRNPTLAKCGGEAQHLEKVRIWSRPGLPNVQSSTARSKTPRIEVFLVSLERSWRVDIENGLALAIWTSAAQVMGKRRAGSQTGSLTPDYLKPGIDLFSTSEVRVRYVVAKISPRDTSLVQTSSRSDLAVGSYELPKSQDSTRDNFGTISELQPGSLGKKWHSSVGAAECHRVYYREYSGCLLPSPGRGESSESNCSWLVPTPKGVLECELTTWVVCFDADSSLIY